MTVRVCMPLVVVAVSVVAVLFSACSDDAATVPLPVLTGAEPPVKDKILKCRAAVIDAPSAKTWAHYAYTLDAHGMLVQAEEAYLAAAALTDDAFEYLHLAAITATDLFPERARENFYGALKLRDDYMPTYLHLARVEETLLNFDAARKLYGQVSARGVSTHALLGLGRLALRAGDPTSALEHLTKAATADPEHRQVYEALARTHARLGQPAEAQKAAKRAGDVAEVRFIGDRLRAKVEAESVRAVDRFRRGLRFTTEKRFREAAGEFRAGLEVRPTDVRARLFLADALLRLGEKDEARREVDRVLSQDPGHVEARQLRDRLEK